MKLPQPISKCIQALLLGSIFCGMSVCRAGAESIDFDHVAPDLPGWRIASGGAQTAQESVEMVLDEESPKSGLSCLRIDFRDFVEDVVAIWSSPVPITNSEISIRFFVRSKGFDRDGHVGITGFDAAGERKTIWKAVPIPHNDDWIEVEWTGLVNDGLTDVSIGFIFEETPGGATLWLDDIEVTSL